MSDDFKKYECVICGFIYDEAEGLPDDGIPPGTRWEDIPDDWECPDCGGYSGCHEDSTLSLARSNRPKVRFFVEKKIRRRVFHFVDENKFVDDIFFGGRKIFR